MYNKYIAEKNKRFKSMSANDLKALNTIYNDLNNGFRYGKDFIYPDIKYPFFDCVLYITNFNNIGWSHYGSSANKNTLKNLFWIITVIFKLTPTEFLNFYIRDDKSIIKY